MCSKTLIPNCKTLFGFKQALCQMHSSCDFAFPGRAELLLVVREAGRPRGVLAMASGERIVGWEQGSIWRPFYKGWVLPGLLHLICLEGLSAFWWKTSWECWRRTRSWKINWLQGGRQAALAVPGLSVDLSSPCVLGARQSCLCPGWGDAQLLSSKRHAQSLSLISVPSVALSLRVQPLNGSSIFPLWVSHLLKTLERFIG